MKSKIYYSYVELPTQIRLVSRKLCLDHIFNPQDSFYFDKDEKCTVCDSVIGINDIFSLYETQMFDDIYIFVTKNNEMYFRDETNKPIYIEGWIKLSQYQNGGHYTNDTYYNT